MAIGIMSILFILLFIVMNPTIGVLFFILAPFIFVFGIGFNVPLQN